MSKRQVKPLSVLREEVQQYYFKTRDDFYDSKQSENKVFFTLLKFSFLYKFFTKIFFFFFGTRLYKVTRFENSEKIKKMLQENKSHLAKFPKFQSDPYPEIESLYVSKGRSSTGSGSPKSPKDTPKIELNIQVVSLLFITIGDNQKYHVIAI